MANVLALGSSKTTAKSGKVPPVKLLATNAEGLAPTVKLVSGKTVDGGTPVNAAAFPKLPESRLSVIGKRSPTKKLAGLPFWARSRTWRPLCISERESEKLAAPLGSVSRKVERPPPAATTGGMLENPFPAKTCWMLVKIGRASCRERVWISV